MKSCSKCRGDQYRRNPPCDQYEYKIPLEIQQAICAISEKEFWSMDYLKKQFEEDITFGMKMWTGFFGILERKLEPLSPQDWVGYSIFSAMIKTCCINGPTLEEKARSLFWVRDYVSVNLNVPLIELSAKNLLTIAYIDEAVSNYCFGIDPKKDVPFTTCLELNYNHPLVKEIIDRQSES